MRYFIFLLTFLVVAFAQRTTTLSVAELSTADKARLVTAVQALETAQAGLRALEDDLRATHGQKDWDPPDNCLQTRVTVRIRGSHALKETVVRDRCP